MEMEYDRMDEVYKNGKIYEIVGGGKRYIGSTTEKLSRRLSRHRTNKKAYENNKREWTSCYEILDEPDCVINLILEYPCNSKEELRRKEGEYIKSLDCVNKVIAGRTNEELLNEKRDEYNAKARERNKEKTECASCGRTITKCNLTRHKKICSNIKPSKTGHKYIYQLTKNNSYSVQIIVNGKRICRNFPTLEEALAFRNSY
jgi:Uri superfamily endonuclease